MYSQIEMEQKFDFQSAQERRTPRRCRERHGARRIPRGFCL